MVQIRETALLLSFSSFLEANKRKFDGLSTIFTFFPKLCLPIPFRGSINEEHKPINVTHIYNLIIYYVNSYLYIKYIEVYSTKHIKWFSQLYNMIIDINII